MLLVVPLTHKKLMFYHNILKSEDNKIVTVGVKVHWVTLYFVKYYFFRMLVYVNMCKIDRSKCILTSFSLGYKITIYENLDSA